MNKLGYRQFALEFIGKILVVKELMRGWQLEELNNYRRDNIGSIFD